MKELSVFIDESGDFDLKSAHSPFYIFTLVFHDQSIDINHDIKQLDQHLDEKKFKYHAIHTAPLIRKEPPYQNYSIEDRKVLFNQMYHFTRQTNIQYKSFCYVKRNYEHKDKLISTMARDLSSFLRENLSYYCSFDKIKIYYDNKAAFIGALSLYVDGKHLCNLPIVSTGVNNYYNDSNYAEVQVYLGEGDHQFEIKYMSFDNVYLDKLVVSNANRLLES